MLEILKCSIGGVDWTTSGMKVIPSITVLIVTIIKIAIPIILIIMGMLDLAKAVVSNDEKEMKGAQSKLIKRVIYAVLVFLVVSMVQIIFSALSSSADGNIDKDNISSCISCFINNADDCDK